MEEIEFLSTPGYLIQTNGLSWDLILIADITR